MPKAPKITAPAIHSAPEQQAPLQQADQQVEQIVTRKPSSAGAKVWVYCNLPAGIILQADRMIPHREVTQGGYRDIQIAEKIGEPIKINGNAVPRTVDGAIIRRHRMMGNYAITEGVDKDTWDAWLKSNVKSPMVLNKCIFALPSLDAGKARELKKNLTGLEPFSPDKDVRAPTPPKHLSTVTADDGEEAAA